MVTAWLLLLFHSCPPSPIFVQPIIAEEFVVFPQIAKRFFNEPSAVKIEATGNSSSDTKSPQESSNSRPEHDVARARVTKGVLFAEFRAAMISKVTNNKPNIGGGVISEAMLAHLKEAEE